ncbi:hypothetical protein [Chryseobacterium gambrini]|uniref:Lipoprotein n=1 Tax=Chryseobacterium gambrini TaxID=373672 RepID=A0ABN7CIM2_9FLAO|nr:hypothetical protein CRDW_23910 [Chryseobacterium gambrini]
MKSFFILITSLLFIGCSTSTTTDELVKKKDKIIDSLDVELRDCKAQAKIMADILEKERIELQNKKATE